MVQRVLILITIFSLLTSAWGMEEEFFKEMKCIPPPKPEKVGLDMNWFGSIDRFFVPLWTKLYVRRVASDMFLKDIRFISEFELGSASCLVMKKGNFVNAFGREIKYNMTGDGNSITFIAPWSGAKSGKYSFHMTDNKHYVLGLVCWDDGITSWSVMSTKTCLDPESKIKILDYVRSIGFDSKFVVDENYEMCGRSGGGNYNMMNPYSQFMSTSAMYFNPYTYFGMGMGYNSKY